MKKNLYIKRIVIMGIIGTLLCTALGASATTNANEYENDLISTKLFKGSTGIFKTNTEKVDLDRSVQPIAMTIDNGIPVLQTESNEMHPSMSIHQSGTMCTTFEYAIDGAFEYYPEFLFSTDNGETWQEVGYFPDSYGCEYPTLDDNEFGFHSVLVSPVGEPGTTWMIDMPAEDPTNMAGATNDWGQYNVGPFDMPSVGCYNMDGEEEWNFGGSAFTGYFGYQGANVLGAAWIYYPTSESSSSLSWVTDEEGNALGGFVHSDFVIDDISKISYAIYDNDGDPNLFVRTDDFGNWDEDGYHVDGPNYIVGDDSSNIMYPSIQAYNDRIVIVAVENDNVVCFYSNDGLETYQKSIVANDAMYPDVVLGPDKTTFVCSYVQDGVLYSKNSNDGGVTWNNEMEFVEELNIGYRTSQLFEGLTEVSAVWEDVRNGNSDIYYGTASTVQAPVIEIESISGGFGMKISVVNSGTAEGSDIDWSITFDGGVFVGSETSGTISSLAPGASTTIKTGLILGFGATEVTITVGGMTQKTSAKAFLFFVLGL